MPNIKVQPSGNIYEYEVGKTLLEVLLEEGIFVDNPCNGKGLCGKCKVRILEGELSEPEDTERKLLKQEEMENGVRLSCLVKPETDLEIELMQKERKHQVLTGGYIPSFAFDQDIQKIVVEIQKPTLEDQTSFEDQILRQIPKASLELGCLQMRQFVPGQVTVVLHGNQVIQIEEGNTTEKMYGVAVDIGTTTVVCTLIDMLTGKELAHASMINAQKHFGLDVLTRITYELEHPEDGVEKLQKALVNSINEMIEDICCQSEVSKEWIYEIAVGANCTMMHMLLRGSCNITWKISVCACVCTWKRHQGKRNWIMCSRRGETVLFAIGIRLYWSRHCSRSLCMSASKRIWECAIYRYRNEWGNRIIQSWQIALLFLCSRSGIGRHEYQFRDAGSRRCY